MDTETARRPLLVPLPKGKALYGWSRSTTYRLAKAGDIELVKVGNSTFIVDASAERLIARSRRLFQKDAQ